ncbi:hypothetical protein EMIT051CA3_70239 [Pseudomonas chlororaphis]
MTSGALAADIGLLERSRRRADNKALEHMQSLLDQAPVMMRIRRQTG